MKLTNDTVMVPLTLQIRNKRHYVYITKDGVFDRHRQYTGACEQHYNHHIVQTFEETVNVDDDRAICWSAKKNNMSVYWKALPLRPGRYKVEIAIKDVNNPEPCRCVEAERGCSEVRRRPALVVVADFGRM